MKYLRECLAKIVNIKKRGLVLDLGCGNGKLTKFFLVRGFSVHCVDKSREAINKLKKELWKLGKQANIQKANLERFSWKKNYDVIITKNVLHLLSSKKEAAKLINQMKRHTKKKGITLIVGLTTKDPFYNENKFFIKENKIMEMYKDWDILFLKSFFTSLEKHNNLPLHRHHVFIGLFQRR